MYGADKLLNLRIDLGGDVIFESDARGNLVADAYLAALAIETGCTWITSDRDYARFEGLEWRAPGAA